MQNLKLKTLIILTLTSFLLLKTVNLFLADIAFAKGYKANLAGNWEQSAKLIEAAVKLNRHEPTYFRELADAYCMLGDTNACLENAATALSLNPYDSLTLKALIKTFIRAGLLENAGLLTEKLISLAPTDEESRQLKDYLKQFPTQ
ncbi:MAG: hypothetical protein ABH814_02410 [bacterium]